MSAADKSSSIEKRFIKAEDLPNVPFLLEGISSRFIRENMAVPLELKNNILHSRLQRQPMFSSIQQMTRL
jgi:hypothetical protein